MKNTITYAQALEMAIKVCSVPANSDEYSEVVEKLTALKEKYSKPRKSSDEAKAKAKAKRADARATLLAQVLPILRDTITTDMTAKEIFAAASDRLPEDFTDKKVQYILLNEMKDEVVKTEAKGKPNTYRLK